MTLSPVPAARAASTSCALAARIARVAGHQRVGHRVQGGVLGRPGCAERQGRRRRCAPDGPRRAPAASWRRDPRSASGPGSVPRTSAATAARVRTPRRSNRPATCFSTVFSLIPSARRSPVGPARGDEDRDLALPRGQPLGRTPGRPRPPSSRPMPTRLVVPSAVEHRGDVALDGLLRHPQGRGDLAVAEARRGQAGDRPLGRCQRAPPCAGDVAEPTAVDTQLALGPLLDGRRPARPGPPGRLLELLDAPDPVPDPPSARTTPRIRARMTSRSLPTRAARMPASADSRMPASVSCIANDTRARMRPSAARGHGCAQDRQRGARARTTCVPRPRSLPGQGLLDEDLVAVERSTICRRGGGLPPPPARMRAAPRRAADRGGTEGRQDVRTGVDVVAVDRPAGRAGAPRRPASTASARPRWPSTKTRVPRASSASAASAQVRGGEDPVDDLVRLDEAALEAPRPCEGDGAPRPERGQSSAAAPRRRRRRCRRRSRSGPRTARTPPPASR